MFHHGNYSQTTTLVSRLLAFTIALVFASSSSYNSVNAQQLHPDIRAVVDVEGLEQVGGGGWADSYSVGDRCYCSTTFDHNIGEFMVEIDIINDNDTTTTTNSEWMSIRKVCELLGPGPGRAGRPLYNDIQCGNGPPNLDGDEHFCPGRVGLGREGCGQIGPKWKFFDIPAPTPVPTPVPTSAPITPVAVPKVGRVVSFTLINAATNKDIQVLSRGGTNIIIRLSNIFGSTALTPSFSIRANVDTSSFSIGSVGFGLDGNPNFSTENLPVYALGGNRGFDPATTNYLPVAQLAQIGTHTVTAKPFSESNQNGIQGATFSATFTVVA